MMEADNCARGEESKRREALNELQFCFCLGSEGRWAVRFGWLKNAAWKELQEHVEQRVVAVLRQCIAAAEQRSCVRSVTKKKHSRVRWHGSRVPLAMRQVPGRHTSCRESENDADKEGKTGRTAARKSRQRRMVGRGGWWDEEKEAHPSNRGTWRMDRGWFDC